MGGCQISVSGVWEYAGIWCRQASTPGGAVVDATVPRCSQLAEWAVQLRIADVLQRAAHTRARHTVPRQPSAVRAEGPPLLSDCVGGHRLVQIETCTSLWHCLCLALIPAETMRQSFEPLHVCTEADVLPPTPPFPTVPYVCPLPLSPLLLPPCVFGVCVCVPVSPCVLLRACLTRRLLLR